MPTSLIGLFINLILQQIIGDERVIILFLDNEGNDIPVPRVECPLAFEPFRVESDAFAVFLTLPLFHGLP
jgi:hypothetical protein